jgi:drug/metabolite transporter (DMT)-like permease
MSSHPYIFGSTLLLGFAVTLAVAGLFGAYFGKGRSRAIGFVVCLIAILLAGLFCALTWPLVPSIDPIFDPDLVGQSMVAVVAALIGALGAGLFFVTTMSRS